MAKLDKFRFCLLFFLIAYSIAGSFVISLTIFISMFYNWKVLILVNEFHEGPIEVFLSILYFLCLPFLSHHLIKMLYLYRHGGEKIWIKIKSKKN